MSKKLALILIALIFSLFALADRPMPKSIRLNYNDYTLDLAAEDSFTLEASVSPEGASTNFKWTSSNESVLTVDNGIVTAFKCGNADVSVRVHGNYDVIAVCRVTVTDSRSPERLIVYPSAIEAEPSRGIQLECVVMPQSAGYALVYASSNPAVAQVSKTGYVNLLAPGRATITVTSAYFNGVSAEIPVRAAYGERIRALSVDESSLQLEKGENACLTLHLTPENGSRAVVFSSEDESVAVVDENGRVTAVGYGLTAISVSSHRDPSIAVSVPVTVTDTARPESIACTLSLGTLMNVGESQTLSAVLSPASAVTDFTLSSSREDIVRLDGNTLTALKRGMSVVTVQSAYREDLKQEFIIAVQDGTNVLEMPLRRTDASGITDNLARIQAVKDCALQTLQGLKNSGAINTAEYNRRVKVMDNAFEMYAFPWTVDKTVKYWKAIYSEDGAKDFQPGVIYYGLPYTSGTNHNRSYNTARALEQQRYLPVEGEAYYLLNRASEDYASGYAGNDCSAFVAQALWGYTIYNGDTVKTGTLYYDERLRPFDDPEQLKPGDILVRHSLHVVMFLYWADEAHTQAVFIQQGGSEPAINTINAYIQEITYYTEDFYRLRRLAEY